MTDSNNMTDPVIIIIFGRKRFGLSYIPGNQNCKLDVPEKKQRISKILYFWNLEVLNNIMYAMQFSYLIFK